jgi:hypothetical protein
MSADGDSGMLELGDGRAQLSEIDRIGLDTVDLNSLRPASVDGFNCPVPKDEW